MLFFIRVVCVAIVGLCFGAQANLAISAEVPVTTSSDPGGLFSAALGAGGASTRVRETCDPEFWDVLKDRAWEEGQREITQNQNLIARPDSVLALSCFDSFLNHLANYADNNFPGDPDHSRGGSGGVWNQLAIDALIFDFGQIFGGGSLSTSTGYEAAYNLLGDPGLTTGFKMTAVLEILVLDQLVDINSLVSTARDVASMPICAGIRGGDPKLRFWEHNFPGRMLGDRARSESGGGLPSWPNVSRPGGSSVSETNYNGCARMNQVWNRAKCYNFGQESTLYRAAPPGGDHDGFYRLANYAVNNDYRTEPSRCALPSADNEPTIDVSEEVCRLAEEHGSGGTLPIPQHTIWSLLPGYSQNSPTWASAHAGANPAPGAPGGADVYQSYLSLRDSTNCSAITPVKTGYIVRSGTVRYVDAVCPAPGCYFDPPSTIGGTGSCRN